MTYAREPQYIAGYNNGNGDQVQILLPKGKDLATYTSLQGLRTDAVREGYLDTYQTFTEYELVQVQVLREMRERLAELEREVTYQNDLLSAVLDV